MHLQHFARKFIYLIIHIYHWFSRTVYKINLWSHGEYFQCGLEIRRGVELKFVLWKTLLSKANVLLKIHILHACDITPLGVHYIHLLRFYMASNPFGYLTSVWRCQRADIPHSILPTSSTFILWYWYFLNSFRKSLQP